tara:strand:+ start:1953 stop:2480 length:528 start_codon:yes stop_codon:yes gene_type:complete
MEVPNNILRFILSELNGQIENIREETNATNATNSRASKEFIDSLEEIEMDKPNITCSICLEEFKIGDKCLRLPCKGQSHYFHNENDTCTGIKKWLEKSNTCPICRTEFPKENLTETINEDIEEEERIIRDMDNRVQFMLNSMLNQRIRIMNPQEIIEMEEQRQLDAAIQASLEDQ